MKISKLFFWDRFMKIIRVFLFGFFVLFLTVSAAQARMMAINGTKVNLRSGPGQNYSVIWELGRGFPLRVLSSKGKWVKVQDYENDTGWVHQKFLDQKAHLIVKKKRINIRSGPSTRFRVVGKANYGVVFRTLERKKGWVKVKHENGLSGWVLRSLLWGW